MPLAASSFMPTLPLPHLQLFFSCQGYRNTIFSASKSVVHFFASATTRLFQPFPLRPYDPILCLLCATPSLRSVLPAQILLNNITNNRLVDFNFITYSAVCMFALSILAMCYRINCSFEVNAIDHYLFEIFFTLPRNCSTPLLIHFLNSQLIVFWRREEKSFVSAFNPHRKGTFSSYEEFRLLLHKNLKTYKSAGKFYRIQFCGV